MEQDISEKIENNNLQQTPQKRTRFLDQDIPEEKLPSLIRDLSRQIDVAWEEATAGGDISDIFNVEQYRRVSDKMPELSVRVQATALKLISSEEASERDLGMKILFHGNLKTILKVVDNFAKKGPSEEELLERGILATIGTIKSFKPGSESLNKRIHGQVTAVSEESLAEYMDVPVSWVRGRYITKISHWIGDFHYKHGRLPNAQEIAKEFNIRAKEVEYQIAEGVLSTRHLGDNPAKMMEEKEVFRPVDRAFVADIISKSLEQLPERDEKVLRMRFGLPPWDKVYTLDEVARELGRTRERVRQLEARAVRMLRAPRFRLASALEISEA